MEQTTQPTAAIYQEKSAISPASWAIYTFVAGIPLIGFIMLLVWAFGGDVNRTRSSWAKGVLLLYALITVLYLLVVMMFGLALFGMSGS